jgi:fibronectin type 3 domain-containing protein
MKLVSVLLLLTTSLFSQLTAKVEVKGKAQFGSAVAAPSVSLLCSPPATGQVPTSYNFYRSTTSGTGYVIVGSSPTCAYSDNNVAFSTTYFYVATSAFQTFESGDSNQVSAVVPANPVPNPPTALTVGSIVASVPLKWTAPVPQSGTTVASYSVFRGGTATLPSPTKIATVTGTSFTDLTPLKGTHYYEVKANDVANGVKVVSAHSNIVKAVI